MTTKYHRSERHFSLDAYSAPDTAPAIHWLPCRDGPCAGGTKLCPTPDACRHPDITPRRYDKDGSRLLWWVFIAAGLAVLAVLGARL